MNQFLFNLTIGPVQGFIAQARKTHDLFAGSSLLSYLARYAYWNLSDLLPKGEVELIFPSFSEDRNDNSSSNPNRFSAWIQTHKTQVEMAEIGREAEARIRERFAELGRRKMTFLPVQTLIRAQKQLEQQLEIFWAVFPVEPSSYRKTFLEIESFINGAKNFRPFAQVEEAGRKCSIDGQLNVVFYRKTIQESNQERIPKLFAKADFTPYVVNTDEEHRIKIWELQPGEGLSAVSFAKRTYQQHPHQFYSSAKVCILHELEAAKAWPAWEKRQRKLLKPEDFSHSEEMFFFEENISEKAFLRSGAYNSTARKALEAALAKGKQHRSAELMAQKTAKEAAQKAAQEHLQHYRQSLRELNQFRAKHSLSPIRLSNRYFGILIFDGDQMGDWLSGAKLSPESDLLAFHRFMAHRLADFGKAARAYLQAPRGQTVYAGGDDFLGFLNLYHLMESLNGLRERFDQLVNQPIQSGGQGFQVTRNNPFTFSAGIAIGHYKQPLGMVLDEARAAEKWAKKGGRDTVAFSLIRHSGGTTRCIRSFGIQAPDAIQGELSAMERICQHLGNKRFSNKFIHNLIQETRHWAPKVQVTGNQFNSPYFTELKRLVQRAKSPSTTSEEVQGLIQDLQLLWQSDLHRLSQLGKDPQDALSNFLSTLRICDFLNRSTYEKDV